MNKEGGWRRRNSKEVGGKESGKRLEEMN